MGIGRPLKDVYKESENKKNKNNATNTKQVVEFKAYKPKYDIKDLILDEATRNKILDVPTYAKNSKKVFEEWDLQSTHKYSKKIGINLWGSPGTGKTMAAHAIAKYLNRDILVIDYADIESKYVGETSKNLRRAFDTAKQTGAILFFDEADAILSRRVTGMEHATDVSVNQTRTEMLLLLNDYEDIILFATNFIENFDPAFMRRILMHIEFKLPNEPCRLKLWEKYVPSAMPNKFDLPKAAKDSDGLSGSDISNAILNAAFAAARQNEEIVGQSYLNDAIKDIKASKEANQKKKFSNTKIEQVDKKDIPPDVKILGDRP